MILRQVRDGDDRETVAEFLEAHAADIRRAAAPRTAVAIVTYTADGPYVAWTGFGEPNTAELGLAARALVHGVVAARMGDDPNVRAHDQWRKERARQETADRTKAANPWQCETEGCAARFVTEAAAVAHERQCEACPERNDEKFRTAN